MSKIIIYISCLIVRHWVLIRDWVLIRSIRSIVIFKIYVAQTLSLDRPKKF